MPNETDWSTQYFCSEWSPSEFSACGDELDRIAVVGHRFGARGRYTLDIFSEQDGNSPTTLAHYI